MARHRRGPGGPLRLGGRYTPKATAAPQAALSLAPPLPQRVTDDSDDIDATHDLHLLEPPPGRVDFDRCPICLSTGPLTEEHVPPEAVGGRVVTSTCSPCNNNLGSWIDRPLIDSMFGRFASFKLSTEASNGVQGFRTYKNVRLARGNGHDLAVWIDGTQKANRAELLAGATSFDTKAVLPDPKAFHLGELKSLYLASCVIAGEILSGETAERVRDDLVAVRDNRAELATRDIFDITQWNRWIIPFDADVTRPVSQPVYQAVVARNGRLIPAVAWCNFTCEEPFDDSPELAARLEEGCQFLDEGLRAAAR